jgi:ubiquinone/menaquinone biosynthesis C-methylase UbiE
MKTKQAGPFGRNYSENYDIIYADKDYDAEASYLERLIRRFGNKQVHRILELGCGTGSYTVRLAKAGRRIVAVDRSEDMLRAARAKAASSLPSRQVKFLNQDITSLSLEGTFDCCVAMFDVINYIFSITRLKALLGEIRRVLTPGSLFIFDMWNGASVVAQGLSNRTKVAERGNTLIVRFARPEMLRAKNQCVINYTTFRFEGPVLVGRSEESHRLRFYFPNEMKSLLRSAGFEVLSVHPFMRKGSSVTAGDFNIAAVARRPSKLES